MSGGGALGWIGNYQQVYYCILNRSPLDHVSHECYTIARATVPHCLGLSSNATIPLSPHRALFWAGVGLSV